MPVTLDDRASRLLELMREADDEAVTLDELEIAGVPDPALALRALELAGIGVERVIDRTQRGTAVSCVRLARTGRARTGQATLELPAAAPPAEAPAAAAPLSVIHISAP
ncbi:MAG: hypothetical protein IRZ32_08850, partial [Solirubrobacteraceae bacterium]|nr:hypothetical protein [Solirubrobacteraceae bacterium]